METFLKQCYRQNLQNFVKIFLYTAKRNVQKHCGKRVGKAIRTLLKVAPCVNRELRGNPNTEQCSNQFLNQTKQLINIKEDRVKITHVCW